MLPFLLFLAASLVTLPTEIAAQGVDAWHLDTLHTIATERLDPIVSPNAVASHLHRIVGGSQIGSNYNYDQYSGASCSSAAVQADKSNYWMPQLFWMENGTYTPLGVGTRFYYFLDRNNVTTPVQAFPKGLRILIGDPNAKSYDATGLPTGAAGFICLNQHFSTPTLDTAGPNFNFATDCPMGLTTTIKFPPCWDGVNLYKDDGSHMAYPNNLIFGSCPYSHPVRLPAIMLEYIWGTNTYRPGVPLAGHLTWANGDTTGYGVHGDFVNGWDVDVLNRALNDPACVGLGDMTMTDCPVLSASMDAGAASACKPSRGVLETYADNIPLKSLPGCNIPWSSGAKPTCAPSVLDPAIPSALTGTGGSLVYPGGTYHAPSATGNSWIRLGCIGGQTTLQNMIQYTDSTLTIARCNAYCYEWGMQYSGLISGSYCQCGTGFDHSSTLWPDTKCNSKCSGDATDTCGGNGLLEIFYNPSSTNIKHISTASLDPQYIGCRHDGYNGRALSGSSISYSKTTVEWCKYHCNEGGFDLAAIEYGHLCMCGDAWTFGGGAPMPQSYCDTPCGANATEMCGGPYLTISAYNLTIPAGTASDQQPSSISSSIKSSLAATIVAAANSSVASTTSVKVISTAPSVATTTSRAVETSLSPFVSSGLESGSASAKSSIAIASGSGKLNTTSTTLMASSYLSKTSSLSSASTSRSAGLVPIISAATFSSACATITVTKSVTVTATATAKSQARHFVRRVAHAF